MKIKQPCAKDCRNRSMECRLNCEDWKEYRAAKEADYEKRAAYMSGQPDHPGKDSNIRRKARNQIRGHQ